MGELQEMNRKLSKLTSKNKVILGFETYSYLCLSLQNMFLIERSQSGGGTKLCLLLLFFGYNLEKEE
jgi:hypothetical protein